MTTDRITNPLRLPKGSHQPGSGKGCATDLSWIGKVLVGAAGAVISIGLAAPAGADPVTTAGASQPSQPGTPQDFLAAARAAGITGTDPAMLGDGYNACWQLWNQHAPGTGVARGPGARLSPDHRPSGSFRAGRLQRSVPGARRV